MPNQRKISPEVLQEARRLIDRALDQTEPTAESLEFNELLAARRETDPVARADKTVAALKEGGKKLQAIRDRLRERQNLLPGAADEELDPESRREIDALREHVMQRIRKRTEEVIARNYPEQSGGKRRPPSRRRMPI